MNRESLKALLRDEEGTGPVRNGMYMPYFDCCGKFFRECKCEKQGLLTIANGRCIERIGVSPGEKDLLLDNDIARAVADCRTAFPWFNSLDDTRQNVLCSMAFMGIEKLKGFTRMLAAIERGDFQSAANEILCSKYASEVGKRAVELAQMMRDGDTIH